MKGVIRRFKLPRASGGADAEASRRLREGDAARDARDWPRAEQAYKAFLDGAPDRAAIWVQYGHALKEQGKLTAAEAAYRRSVALRPGEADTHLQLGHLLKRQGRLEEARDAYARSLQLQPTRDAQEELARLGSPAGDSLGGAPGLQQESPPAVETVFFEVDSLLGYLWRNTTLSGIQRVQVNVFRHLLRLTEAGEAAEYRFVRYDEGRGEFRQIDHGALGELIEYCSGNRLDRDRLDPLLREAERRACPAGLRAGQCFFITGAFWDYRSMERYLKVKAVGASIGVVLYDLIPVDYPEFCDAWLVSDFSLSLAEGFLLFDFVVTTSEFSAKEIRRYLDRHRLRPVPVEVVRLAHLVKDEADPARDEWSDALLPLRDRPYVLSVGTIEARKNHAYLVAAWKLLLQEGVEPPDLVLVGRGGMRTRDFMDQLRATRFMDGRVHVLHGLSDGELGTLYRHCLFTAVPSFVEGWGQVPGESLSYGVPCVASNAASLPEVGGDLVDYVDPYCVRDGVAAFRRMMLDTSYREGRRAAIRAGFRPRRWEDFSTDLLRRIAEHGPATAGTPASAPARGAAAPLLPAGRVFRVGDLHQDRPVPPDYPSSPLRLVFAEGAYPPDTWGSWLRSREALLRFATSYQAGSEVVLYLRFFGASRMDGVSLTVSDLGGEDGPKPPQFPASALRTEVTIPVRSDGRFTARLLARVGRHGIVEARLAVEGDVPTVSETDHTRLSVGIVAMAYALRSDATARADLIDAFAREV